jgi:hypothetical protein
MTHYPHCMNNIKSMTGTENSKKKTKKHEASWQL